MEEHSDTMENIKKHFDVSRETIQKLEKFAKLLLKWNKSTNLIAKSTETELWNRHILDSLQLLKLIGNEEILDIGTGAGFPGVVISIAGGNKVFLVEKNAKKCAFLHQVKAEIGGNFEIINESIEHIPVKNIEIITCRAFASVKKILELTCRLLAKDTKLLLLKGESYKVELDEAKSSGWYFDHEVVKSITNKSGAVLILSNIGKNE